MTSGIRPKTFFFYHHQTKADQFEKALKDHGWREDRSLRNTGVAFFDTDVLGRISMFNDLHNKGVKLLLYPHAARPQVVYAWSNCKPHEHTKAHFVFSPGHKEVMEAIGYPHPIHIVGWNYCEKKPFTPTGEIKNVLFGPIHPNRNGWLSPVDKRINLTAFQNLLAAQKKMGFHLTVRYLNNLDSNGLPSIEKAGISYVIGRPDNSYKEIDDSDLVVSTQTLGYISVARGRPTVMFSEDVAPRAGNKPSAFRFINGWDKFKHLMMYPLDLNTTNNICRLIESACSSDRDIRSWRERMIGDDFDPKLFSDLTESYL